MESLCRGVAGVLSPSWEAKTSSSLKTHEPVGTSRLKADRGTRCTDKNGKQDRIKRRGSMRGKIGRASKHAE